MKLLFIENRYALWMYEAIASRLIADGHDIHWLIQNPVFQSDLGTTHIVPFPKGSQDFLDDPAYHFIKNTDRGYLHFGMPGMHYRYYDNQIESILRKVDPDFVFGEATQFHELLAIHQCRQFNIPYLSPNATRYPSGRMCFLNGDSMDTVGGSGDELDDKAAKTMLDDIVSRRQIPSYMLPQNRSPYRAFTSSKIDLLRILFGYMRGERYSTPSPWRKRALEKQHVALVKEWEKLARPDLPSHLRNAHWVLYPLQMQPEGNLDVWGQPWNNQADTVARTAQALNAMGVSLVVKPNPKSKYEISEDLLDAIRNAPNIIALRHDTKMSDFFPSASMILGVTGTVLMESVFAGKPAAVLGQHGFSKLPGLIRLNTPEDIAPALKKLLQGEVKPTPIEQAIALLKELYRSSYPGQLFDPLNQPEYLHAKNIDLIATAFIDQINQHVRLSKTKSMAHATSTAMT